MRTVKIHFQDSKFDYYTSVNSKVSKDDIKKYFVNKYFDLGVYPVENFLKCIGVTTEE